MTEDRARSVAELRDENDLLCKVILETQRRLLYAACKGNDEAREIYKYSIDTLMPLLEQEDNKITSKKELSDHRTKTTSVTLLREAYYALVNAMEKNDGKIEYARSAWDLIFRIEKELE